MGIMSQKVCVIGLDCAAPELVFDLWADRLPNLRRFMVRGAYGSLESATPPITVPAWMCMMTGCDPGSLGVYGFRNRRDHTYEGLAFASSRLVHLPTVWDVVGGNGRKSIVLGVPLTYPPRPVNGLLVSDFLAPDTNSEYTYPPELKEEIRAAVGEYIFDTRDFRTDDRARLLADIYAMTRQRFQLARHLATKHPWDLFIMVEMGPDRMHHAFWRYFDPKHPKYVPGAEFENAIRDYYIALDAEIGRLLSVLDPHTRVLIVSDHGAKRMEGGICFNEWLIREGYLVLKQPVEGLTKFSPDLVDWPRTRAWGDGGYYGRLFLNLEGREPQGIVAPQEAEALKSELTARLEALGDEHGRPIGTKVFRPDRIYAECRNVAPDLIVYFGDLYWRSVGSVGHGTVWTHENDIGPDDANHAQQGIFLMADAGDLPPSENSRYAPLQPRREGLSLYDVAPTILKALGITPPPGMGRDTISPAPPPGASVYTEAEEEELARRLEDLGYL
jgi:predicted AlkP superfamily phosphohydrolase/phosphomutase